jgi:hypothetical protein
MARKITTKAIEAFLNNKSFSSGNTRVIIDGDWTKLILYSTTIAQKRIDTPDRLILATGGWNTPTTKERLNALPGVSIYQKNHDWFLNGELWNGSSIMIKA